MKTSILRQRCTALATPVAWITMAGAYWDETDPVSGKNIALLALGFAAIVLGIRLIRTQPKKQVSSWSFAAGGAFWIAFAWAGLLLRDVVPYASWRAWVLASGTLIQILPYVITRRERDEKSSFTQNSTSRDVKSL